MSIKDDVYIALFAALTATLGLLPALTLSVSGVPITAQSMGAMMAGAVLGAKRGALSLILFLVLVAIGLPLLAGGRGGFGVFLGPSAGFLFGWVPAAATIGFLFERFWARLNIVSGLVIVFLGGVIVEYAFGIAWIVVIGKTTLLEAALSSAIFIPGDMIKVAAATAVALSVRRSYPLIAAANV